jgi:hypothetical protein
MLRGLFENIYGAIGFIIYGVKHLLGIAEIKEKLEETGTPVPETPLTELVSEIERGESAREEYYALSPWDHIPENMFTETPTKYKEPYVYRYQIDYITPEGYKVTGKWVQFESPWRYQRATAENILQDILTNTWYSEEIEEYEITDVELYTHAGE